VYRPLIVSDTTSLNATEDPRMTSARRHAMNVVSAMEISGIEVR
jgi:hypothetical protein